jgi:hypothetical protein
MLETVENKSIQNQSFPNPTNQNQTTEINTNPNLTETKQEDEMPTANNYKISKSQRTSFELFPKEINWPKTILDYDYSKRNLEWKFNKKPFIRNQKLIKKIENQFHPILQKYYDDKINIAMNNNEKIDLKNQLAKNYDYQLKYEQSYNIINLKDKLKGFENHPNYPKQEKNKIKLIEENFHKKCYNIISNISLSKHNFLPPEQRPKCKNENSEEKPKLINSNIYKDYDIISNRYKLFNDEKKATDLEFAKLNAAKKFYEQRDYDCLRGKYYDPEKQKKYEDELKEKNEKLKNAKRDCLFNPVNNEIYDKEKLDSYDRNHGNSKYRYQIKPQIENYYRTKEYNNDIKKENALKNRLSYDRYKLEDQRGYDFFNMKNNFNHYKLTQSCNNKKNPWELLKDKAGENETFSKKQIYKEPYDKTDVDKNEFEFRQRRQELLKNLPRIEDVESFKRKEFQPKIIQRQIETSSFPSRPNFMDKSQWFKNPKSIDMYNFKPRLFTQN